jgi:hypothetical protein
VILLSKPLTQKAVLDKSGSKTILSKGMVRLEPTIAAGHQCGQESIQPAGC